MRFGGTQHFVGGIRCTDHSRSIGGAIWLIFFAGWFVAGAGVAAALEPWSENPWYWSHRGEPVMLLGGSDDDNLFQWPAEKLVPQLDRIAAAGGNVVRNTMSDRKDAGFEVYPFLEVSPGKYDLEQWNPVYWDRFQFFLEETAKREIFVQIEIWDRFDYTDNRDSDPRRWQSHPYNPANNVNYTAQQTTLEPSYPDHPGANKQPFFFSTPEQRNLTELLRYQQAFVNRVLDFALPFDHVLYCIDNETAAEPAWGRYWAKMIHSRASKAGKQAMVTEMWDDWNLRSPSHRETFDHPKLYDYVDVSQNNHNAGDKHWDNFQFVRDYLSGLPRPINTTKTYGADGNKFGHSDQDAIERFWRHLLGGAASIRFHRPDSGLGINDKAVACIVAARRMMASVPVWNLLPAQQILGQRQSNEAYAAATDDFSTIVLFFPAGRTGEAATDRRIELKLDGPPRRWQATWIDIDRGRVADVDDMGGREISPPGDGNFVAVLRVVDQPMLPGELFEVDGHRAFIFMPPSDKRREPQPWVLYSPTLLPNYPDEHERWMHQQFLDAGVAVAGVDVGEAYGSPESMVAIDRLYQVLTEQKGFASRMCLLGRSRGGLWSAAWGARHPDRIAGLAGIYPVFDLTTYPGIDTAAPVYGLTADEFKAQLPQLNPIAKAEVLAREGIPVHLIHGIDDTVVPIEKNSDALAKLYRSAGQADAVSLERVAGQGHNYWPGFFRSQPLIDFVIRTATEAATSPN
jgi:predicted esterase